MELREMKSLIALSECGSIRAAALQCNLSPAAIHKHLKTLEADFAVQIYKKERGHLSLTEAGQMLLPFLRAILLKYEATFTAISEWKDAKCGLVRVEVGYVFRSLAIKAALESRRNQSETQTRHYSEIMPIRAEINAMYCRLFGLPARIARSVEFCSGTISGY